MASLNGSNTFIVHNSPLGPGPKTKRWGQAPRSNFSAGVRPQSEVLIKDLQIFVFLEIMSYLCTRIWLKIQEKLFRH